MYNEEIPVWMRSDAYLFYVIINQYKRRLNKKKNNENRRNQNFHLELILMKKEL